MTIATHTDRARPVFRSRWERRLGKVESPIEGLFLESFCAQAEEWGYHVGKSARLANSTILVAPQKWIDQRRVDFLITFAFHGVAIELAVECDGHAFHERTKAQAAHDRRRDRELQRAGFEVFRFTGSELHRDPARCGFEVLDAIMEFQTGVILKAMEASP